MIFRGLVSAGNWFSSLDYNAASKDPVFRDRDHVSNLLYIQKDQAFVLPLLMFLAHKVS